MCLERLSDKYTRMNILKSFNSEIIKFKKDRNNTQRPPDADHSDDHDADTSDKHSDVNTDVDTDANTDVNHDSEPASVIHTIKSKIHKHKASPSQSALKATIIDRNPRTINTVSLTSYMQSNCRNWKREKVHNLVDSLMKLDESKTPVTTISKYEVLYETVRKIYFDIERIPFSDENAVFELLTDINKFFRKKCGDQMKEDMKFIITYNKSSANHSGKSYHAYCMNYCMNFKILRNTVAEFVNTDGKKYKDYVDCSVYSKNRLFKMPYYIGVVQDGLNSKLDTNVDNHHMIISQAKPECALHSRCECNDEDVAINANLIVYCNSKSDFYNGIVIQSIQGTTQLNLPMVYGEKVYRTKNISFGGVTNTRRLLQSVKHLETIILDKKVGTATDDGPNIDKLMNIIVTLFDNKHRFNEIITEKIETMHSYYESRKSYDKNVLLRYEIMINNIKQHNSSIFEELEIEL